MDEKLDRIDTTESSVQNQIDSCTRAVSRYAKQAKSYTQQMLALASNVDPLKRQIEQTAAHLHLKLSY